MTPSVPPTTATSARPSRSMSRPSEIDSLLEAQADTGVCAPARAPSRRLTLAAEALAISIGMASGLTRRAPFSFWTSQLPSSVMHSADAGRDGDAEPLSVDRVVLSQPVSSVVPSLHRGDDRKLRAPVEPARLDPF